MTTVSLFGTVVEPCPATDPAAIGAAVQVGSKTIRPPIAVARIVERLGAGNATMTESELDHLDLIGVRYAQVQDPGVPLAVRWGCPGRITVSTGFKPIKR